MLWASVNGGVTLGMVAAHIPSSSPVAGLRCACSFFRSVARAPSSLRLIQERYCAVDSCPVEAAMFIMSVQNHGCHPRYAGALFEIPCPISDPNRVNLLLLQIR